MSAAYNAANDHQIWLTSNHVTWQKVMSKLKGGAMSRIIFYPTIYHLPFTMSEKLPETRLI